MEGDDRPVDPATIGFDAAVEFAPDWTVLPPPVYRREAWDVWARVYHQLEKISLLSKAYARHSIYAYEALMQGMPAKPAPIGYTRFRCATPGWDNSRLSM